MTQSPMTLPPRSSSTPTMLTFLRLVTVLTIVLFTVASTLSITNARTAGNDAQRGTEQVLRGNALGVLLAQTNHAALVDTGGGPGLSANYASAMAKSWNIIADAAVAEPADRQNLSRLNVALSEYNRQIADAVDSGRGDATAAKTATMTLEQKVLPIIHELVATNTARVEHAKAEQSQLWLWVTASGVIVALAFTSWFLAARTHRIVNLGVLVSLLALIAGLWLGTSAVATTIDDAATSISTIVPRSTALAASAEHLYAAGARTQLIAMTSEPAGGPLSAERKTHIDASRKVGDVVTHADLIKTIDRCAADSRPEALKSAQQELTKAADTNNTAFHRGKTFQATRLNLLGIGNLIMAVVSIVAVNWGIGKRQAEYR